nr:hypothetical protein [Tanacetum cinerariifolium]
VEENLHVKFNENTHNIAGIGPNWLFDIDALTKSMNYKPVVTGNQSNGNAGTKACDDAGKARVDTVPGKDYTLLSVSTVGTNTSIELLFNPKMPDLEDITIFNFSNDHEDVDEMADMNNLDIAIQVSPTPATRVHKDHPLNQVIRDV